MIMYNGERIIPIGYINNDYRAYTVSEYAAAGTVGMYYYTGGTYDSYVTNGSTRVYHQPSLYGDGITNEGGRHRSAKIAVLMSVHFSPLSQPTLGVAPGVVAGATDCRYVDGNLDLQRVDAEHAIHNVVNTGNGVSLETSWGFDAYTRNCSYYSKATFVRASAWFLLRVNTTGNMAANFGKINYTLTARTPEHVADNDTADQYATVVQPATIGEWKYYVVKTLGGHSRLRQSYPYSSSDPALIYYLQRVYQPKVEINFTGSRGTCTVQAMSWGYDVWAEDWVS